MDEKYRKLNQDSASFLQAQALRGSSPTTMARALLKAHPSDVPPIGQMITAFTHAFDIPVKTLTMLHGWSMSGKPGTFCDEEIDAELSPFIESWVERFREKSD